MQFKGLFLLILYFCALGPSLLVAQDSAQFPTANLDEGQEWDIIHVFGDKRLAPKSIPIQERLPSISGETDHELFQKKLDRYLQNLLPTMQARKIRLVRFVVDKNEPLSKANQAMIKVTLAKYHLKPRFETISINWQQRGEQLQAQAIAKGDQIIERMVHTEAKEFLAENYVKGVRGFFSDIYSRPTKVEVLGGLVKMSSSVMIAASGQMISGVSPTSPTFWIISAKLILTELLFGPYIKTYLNFLEKKVANLFGNYRTLSIATYGQLQGLALVSFDKFFLYLNDPLNVTPPWDLLFLSKHFGISFFLSYFGASMPSGIFKLTTKGWFSRTSGSLIMQMSDLVFPLEGILFAADSPYFWHVLIAHNMLKFSYYLAGTFLPTRGQMIIAGPGVATTDEFLREILPEQMIHFSYFKESSTGILPYLQSKQVPAKDKLNLLKYFAKQAVRSPAKGPAEQIFLKNIFQAYEEYLGNIRWENPQFAQDTSYQQLAKILQRLPDTYRSTNWELVPNQQNTVSKTRCIDYLQALLGGAAKGVRS